MNGNPSPFHFWWTRSLVYPGALAMVYLLLVANYSLDPPSPGFQLPPRWLSLAYLSTAIAAEVLITLAAVYTAFVGRRTTRR